MFFTFTSFHILLLNLYEKALKRCLARKPYCLQLGDEKELKKLKITQKYIVIFKSSISRKHPFF